MVLGSFSNTQKDQDKPEPNIQHFNTNNNFDFGQASLFYTGKIWGKVGAFSQLTYDGVADTLFLDNTDVRFANQVDLLDQDVVYGLSANNNPAAQDLWNTTPAWGFPYASSPIAATSDGASLLSGGVDGLGGGQIGGVTMYAMINRLLYLEAGGYGSFSNSFMKGAGNYGNWGNPPLNRIDGGAPYWRIALQKEVDGHYFELGHYGMIANVFPYNRHGIGTDTYTDLAMDATYQYLGNLDHIFEVKTTYLRETRDLHASSVLASTDAGTPTKLTNYLDTFNINAAYTYLQTYSLNFGYNKTWIHDDQAVNIYGVSGGGNLGSEYFTAELDYIPFGKDSSLLASLLNLRIGLQYIGYTQFNGSQAQAANYNTFLLNGWLAF